MSSVRASLGDSTLCIGGLRIVTYSLSSFLVVGVMCMYLPLGLSCGGDNRIGFPGSELLETLEASFAWLFSSREGRGGGNELDEEAEKGTEPTRPGGGKVFVDNGIEEHHSDVVTPQTPSEEVSSPSLSTLLQERGVS